MTGCKYCDLGAPRNGYYHYEMPCTRTTPEPSRNYQDMIPGHDNIAPYMQNPQPSAQSAIRTVKRDGQWLVEPIASAQSVGDASAGHGELVETKGNAFEKMTQTLNGHEIEIANKNYWLFSKGWDAAIRNHTTPKASSADEAEYDLVHHMIMNPDVVIKHLSFLWDTYALEDDNKMTDGAKELKRKLLAAIHTIPKAVDEVLAAADAVIKRWEAPSWKDVPATANYIYRLRDALASLRQAGSSGEKSTKEKD